MPENNGLRLLGIVRVSTDRQADDEHAGIARQREAIEDIARRENVVLGPDDIVEIRGVSGSDVAQSSEWNTLVVPRLADSRLHIAVDAVDRLIRASSFEAFRVLAVLQAMGKSIFLPTGILDLSRANDTMISTFLAAIGGHEKSEIARRANGAKEEKRKQGAWTNGTNRLPRGVFYDRKTHTWRYTPEAEAVREAFRLFVHEGLTNLSELARRIGARSPVAVRDWLRQPLYRGVVVYSVRVRKGRKIPRVIDEVLAVRVFPESEQLVSDDIWDAAQRVLKRRASNHVEVRAHNRDSHPYSGFVFADPPPGKAVGFSTFGIQERQHRLYARHYREAGGSKIRYGCICRSSNPARPRQKCNIGQPLGADLHTAFDKYLFEITREPFFIDGLKSSLDTPTASVDAERAKVRVHLDSLTRKARRLQDLFIEGDIDKADYDLRFAAISKEREVMERTQARLEMLSVGPNPDAMDRLAREWLFDPNWTPARKRAWLSRYLEAINISREGIESIVVRVPGPEGTPTACYGAAPRSWESLLGYSLGAHAGRVHGRGLLLTGQVAEALGITCQRLGHLVRQGVLPHPAHRHSTWHAWTREEVEGARKILLDRNECIGKRITVPTPASPLDSAA